MRREELERVVRGLRDGKAAGGDELANEVWKYGREKLRNGWKSFVVRCGEEKVDRNHGRTE